MIKMILCGGGCGKMAILNTNQVESQPLRQFLLRKNCPEAYLKNIEEIC